MYDSLHQNILELFALIGYFTVVAFTQNKLKERYPKYQNVFGGLAIIVFLVGIVWFGSSII